MTLAMPSVFSTFCCFGEEEELKGGLLVDVKNKTLLKDLNASDKSKGQGKKTYVSNGDDNSNKKTIEQRELELQEQIKLKARVTVFAKKFDFRKKELKYYPKTEEEIEFINKSLGDSFIFSDLTNEERRLFIDAFEREDGLKYGTVIFRQGDVGEYFRIVQDGEIHILDNKNSLKEIRTRGQYFGEINLLHTRIHSTTTKVASETCSVWKIHQSSFRCILSKQANEREKKILDQLNHTPLIQKIDDANLKKLITALTPVQFKKNDRIFNKGDEGHIFYIIEKGQVLIHDIGSSAQHLDQILKDGDWFGEQSILTGNPRPANASANTDVSLLALDRKTFEKTLGAPLQEYLDGQQMLNKFKTMPIFASSNITEFELDRLVPLCKEMCYKKGTKLEIMGKTPYRQELIMIKQGNIGIYDENGSVFHLTAGDYFGDKHVGIPDPDRICSRNTICEENTTVHIITRQEIESVIGDIKRLGKSESLLSPQLEKSILMDDIIKCRLLGEGSFGKVWLVKHKESNELFAMKQINKRKLVETKQTDAVLREKDLLCTINHPFIIHMVSTFQDEFDLYMMLNLVSGGELYNLIQKAKAKNIGLLGLGLVKGLSNADAMFYAACILDALGHFHERSICYRDLKPDNVLINAHGYCMIVDLGFAKVVTEKTFTMCGTPEYMAPEVLMSKGYDKAIDYWSLGVLIYEMLCGETPFYVIGSGRSKQIKMFTNIVKGAYVIPDYVDEHAKDLIQRLLVRIPGLRIGNLRNGYLDVECHPWFKNNIDFKKLRKQELASPWIPPTMNFDINIDKNNSKVEHFNENQSNNNNVTPVAAVYGGKSPGGTPTPFSGRQFGRKFFNLEPNRYQDKFLGF